MVLVKPATVVHSHCQGISTDREVLGGAFLVMERTDTGPHHGLRDEGLGQGRILGDLVRFLMRAGKTFREISLRLSGTRRATADQKNAQRRQGKSCGERQ